MDTASSRNAYRWVTHPFRQARTWAKRRLDVRYALTQDLERLRNEVERQEAEIQLLRKHPDLLGSQFVGDEDPHALRRRLFEAHRLAVESAASIEKLLQQEVLLWVAVDRNQDPAAG